MQFFDSFRKIKNHQPDWVFEFQIVPCIIFSRKEDSLLVESTVNKLDTPCTAGARRRRNWWIMPWLQYLKSSNLPLFDGPTPDHVRTLFSRVQKRCPKVDPNLWAFAKDMYTWTTFFQLFKNQVFKTPRPTGRCPPPYFPPAKSNYFPNGRRTQETSDFN